MNRYLFFFSVFVFIGTRSFWSYSAAQRSATDSLLIELSHSEEDTSRVNVLNSLSRELERTAHFDSSLKYAEAAKQLSEKLDFKKGVARAYRNIGMVCFDKENYAGALSNHLESLRINEEIGNEHGIADAYNNIAIIYNVRGNFDEALKNLRIALAIDEKINYREGIAGCYANIGNSYILQGNEKEALKNYLLALKIQQQIGDKKVIVALYNNIGVVNKEIGNYDEALKNHFACLKIHEELGNKHDAASSYENIGETFFAMKKYDDAIIWLNKTVETAAEVKNKSVLKDAYLSLSHLYEKLHDYKNALVYHKLYFNLNDSLFNEKSSIQMAEMKTKYETEKKQKEIELLHKGDEIKTIKIGKQKTTVQYLIGGFSVLIIFSLIAFWLYNQKRKAAFRHEVLETKMKALRAQMNPHFTFNILNSIQYYAGENDMKSVEHYLRQFSKLIRIILDQSRTSYITLDQEITMLKLYLELEEMRFEKKFNYSVEIAGNLNAGKIMIPGMLIQPIVENAIKHGIEHKEGEALINISFYSKNSTLICTVTDNGIGRAEAQRLKTEDDLHVSAATSIIKERMEALSSLYNITLECKTEDLFDIEGKARGTCVTMEMPVKI